MELPEADQAAGEVEQRFVGLGGAFVADVESAVLVEPGEGAFDDPAPATKPGAMRGRSPRDQRCHTERADLSAVELVVVAAVGDQAARPTLRRPRPAAYRRDRVEQQQQLRAFVSVRAGDGPGERDAAAVC